MYSNQFVHVKMKIIILIFVQHRQTSYLSFVMANGRELELEEVESLALLEEGQQQSHLCCSGVLFRFQARPLLLECSLQLLSVAQLSGKAHEDSNHIIVIAIVHWPYPGGEVVIILCLPFGIPIVVHFDRAFCTTLVSQ